MNTIFLGICNAISVVSLTSTTEDVGMQVLYMFISTFVFAFLNLGVKLLTAYLEKKGIISKEDKEKIDEAAEDFADNGKLDGSNKKGEKDE